MRWELGQGADLPSFTDSAGHKRFIEGVGFAIVRDAADFLAHAAADASGNANPLHGAIKRTLAAGKSQSGRYLKTFLLNGFNMADGRRVFDGMHVFVSGAGMLPIMQSGTGPQSSATGAPTFANPEFRGVNEDVLTIGDVIKHVTAHGENPPKMILIDTTTDYFSLRASLSRSGAEGTTEQPIPDNVRVYEIAGASHVIVPRANCDLPPARLDWSPISRATLLHLDNWVAKGTEPPASRLMPLEESKNDPMVLRAPAHLPKAVIQVPKRDEDGNSLGGVRLPDMQAPLGANAQQNPPLSFLCALAAAYVAFPRAQADADATHNQPSPRDGAIQDAQRICEPDSHGGARTGPRWVPVAGGRGHHHSVGGGESDVARAGGAMTAIERDWPTRPPLSLLSTPSCAAGQARGNQVL